MFAMAAEMRRSALKPNRSRSEALIFLGTASSRLGAAICDRLGSRPSAAEVLRFSEDGVFVRFEPARAYDLIQLLESVARLDDPDQIPSCRKLVDYVYANREGIKNYRLIPLASSGPMEKAIDILASRRLKSRGMSWRRPGAHHMVRLRLLCLNNRWDEFWNQRRQAQRREWPVAA
jgi:hypothetical protein